VRTEIINTGRELIEGKKSASSAFLTEKLSSIGISAARITTVSDSTGEIHDVVREALGRANIIFCIGGMGSTSDDITRDVFADISGRKLVFSRKAMENVARYFARRGRDVPVKCENQAKILQGSRVLPNDKGSSPGLFIEVNSSKIFLLPGPVDEVKSLMKGELFRMLKEYESKIVRKSVLHIFHKCESEVYEMLSEVIETERELEKKTVSFSFEKCPWGTDLSIECRGYDELLVDELLHKIRSEVYDFIGEEVFGENKESLETVAGELLARKRLTLGVAESATGGLLSSLITDAPGSSVYFKQGAVFYSTRSKIKSLGVSSRTVENYGAVSEETALEMAQRVRELYGVKCGISITGYAGPKAGEDKEAGTGYIGIDIDGDNCSYTVKFSGSRREIKEKFAYSALGYLWRKLKSE